jgi:putative aldouronate transport system substrate-binding protein
MKKVLMLAVAGLLVAAVAFGTGQTESAEADAEELISLGFDETGYPIVEEEYSLQMGLWQPPQTTQEPEDMPYLVELAEHTGIDVDYQFLGRGNEAYQKVNLHVASGEMLDVYGQWTYQFNNLLQWAQDGQVLYLDELIENYAPNLNRLLGMFDGAEGGLLDFSNGKIVTTPKISDPHRFVHGIPTINKAWLNRLGLDMPGDSDELLEVLRAFRDQDANGNGDPNDEIPTMFEMSNPLWWAGQRTPGYVAAFYFGIPMGPHNIIEDGELVHKWQHPRAQEFVQFLATLYQEGLMPEDVLSIDSSTYNARAAEGNVGVLHQWTTRHNLGNDTAYEEYVWLLPDHDGEAYYTRFFVDDFIQPAMFISASTEHPEITMRWVDTLYSKEPGLKIGTGPIEWLDEEHTTWRTVPVPADTSPGEFRNNKFVPKNAFPDVRDPALTQDISHNTAAVEFAAYHRMIADRGLLPEAVGPIRFWPVTAEQNEQLAPITQEIEAYLETEVAKMIFDGDVSDERWAEFQEELSRLGLDEMMEIENAVYDRALELGFDGTVRQSAVFDAASNLPYEYDQFMELGTR